MDCPISLEATLGEVGDELLMQLGTRRYPLGGTFEVTERCNLACVMCYISEPVSSRAATAREMTLPEIRGVVDELVDAGSLFLVLTGGEPLVRSDFCDIWRYAKGQGLLVSLFTNGTLLSPRIADCLAEWQPMSIEVTLYGSTQETYERVTRVPGSHARCMRGIELAVDRGLRLKLKSTVMKENRHELEAMVALAERLGVPHRFDGMLFPRLDGDQGVVAHRLSPAEVVALDREYPERQEEFNRVYRDFGDVQTRSEYVYSCGAGHRSFHVDSAGRLSACMLARRPSYDLLEGSFEEGWGEFLPAVLRKKRTLDVPCTTCPVGALCVQCPGYSQLVHGDDETPVEYVCEVGRLRYAQTLASMGGSPGEEPVAERSRRRRDGVRMQILTGPPA